MPSGDTFVSSVSEGLDTVIASARTTREFPADVMLKVCDLQKLEDGTGTSWREFLAAQLTAANYGETDTIDNAQELDGSVLSATPQLVAIQTFIGKRVEARLNRKAYGTFGRLAQDAISRKKDQDGLALFSTFSSTVAGTGTTLSHGHILAAANRIASDATEPGPEPYHAVLHGYGIYDIQSEILSSVGSAAIPSGYTQETFMRGFRGMVGNVNVHTDGLIAVDGTPDARGAIFSWYAILCVQGMSPWTEMRQEPQKGYGGTSVWLKDEFIWAERSAGNMAYGALHNATAPTS